VQGKVATGGNPWEVLDHPGPNFVDILKGKAECSYSLSLTSIHNNRKKIHYVISFFDFGHRTPLIN